MINEIILKLMNKYFFKDEENAENDWKYFKSLLEETSENLLEKMHITKNYIHKSLGIQNTNEIKQFIFVNSFYTAISFNENGLVYNYQCKIIPNRFLGNSIQEKLMQFVDYIQIVDNTKTLVQSTYLKLPSKKSKKNDNYLFELTSKNTKKFNKNIYEKFLINNFLNKISQSIVDTINKKASKIENNDFYKENKIALWIICDKEIMIKSKKNYEFTYDELSSIFLSELKRKIIILLKEDNLNYESLNKFKFVRLHFLLQADTYCHLDLSDKDINEYANNEKCKDIVKKNNIFIEIKYCNWKEFLVNNQKNELYFLPKNIVSKIKKIKNDETLFNCFDELKKNEITNCKNYLNNLYRSNNHIIGFPFSFDCSNFDAPMIKICKDDCTDDLLTFINDINKLIEVETKNDLSNFSWSKKEYNFISEKKINNIIENLLGFAIRNLLWKEKELKKFLKIIKNVKRDLTLKIY